VGQTSARLSNILNFEALPKFLQVLQVNFVNTMRAMCTCQLFPFLHNRTAILIIIGPVTVFPLEPIAVNHLYNALSNGANLASFDISHLKTSFMLLLNAINNHNFSFCCFIS